jgi:hypothetical protein
MTASMRVALDDLRLDRLLVMYPGDKPYELAERVEVMPLAALATADPRSIVRRRRR